MHWLNRNGLSNCIKYILKVNLIIFSCGSLSPDVGGDQNVGKIVQLRQSFHSLTLTESSCLSPWIIPYAQSYPWTWNNWWYSTLTTDGFPSGGSELLTLSAVISVKRWRTFQEPSFSLFISFCPLISRSQISSNNSLSRSTIFNISYYA